jgi:hypothetical protein
MLETLLSYGNDADATNLTKCFWYKDDGYLLPTDPMASEVADLNVNVGFGLRWKRIKQTRIQNLYGRLHSDICNVPRYLLPGARIQIKLRKAKPAFFLLNKDANSTTQFKFLDAKLFVKRIRAHPSILLAYNKTLYKCSGPLQPDESRNQAIPFLKGSPITVY